MSLLVLLISGAFAGAITLIAVGSNDVANSQATAVGSGALKLKSAYVLAGLCEFLGSSLMGSNVSSTLGDSFVSHDNISDYDYSWGMLLSLVSSGMWILICTYLKMPASSTHAIVGALIGFELIATDFDPTNLDMSIVLSMVIAWLVTPLMSLFLSFLFMFLLSYYWPIKIILNNKNGEYNHSKSIIMKNLSLKRSNENMHTPLLENENENENEIDNQNNNKNKNAKPEPLKFGILFGIVVTVILLFIMVGGPEEVRVYNDIPRWLLFVIILSVFIITCIIGYILEKPYRKYYINNILNYNQNFKQERENERENETEKDQENEFEKEKETEFVTENYFILFLIIASGAVSFAHGGNDVANVIGPFGEIYVYYKYNSLENNTFSVPIWLSMCGGICIVIGFVLFGKKVLSTVGNEITTLTYRSGFAAQFSSALTVLICNVLQIPVSSTTVIVGAVAGIGFYNNRQTSTSPDTQDDDQIDEIDTKASSITRLIKSLTICIKKIKKMDLRIIGKILLTWFVTIPANAIICGIFYAVFDAASQ